MQRLAPQAVDPTVRRFTRRVDPSRPPLPCDSLAAELNVERLSPRHADGGADDLQAGPFVRLPLLNVRLCAGKNHVAIDPSSMWRRKSGIDAVSWRLDEISPAAKATHLVQVPGAWR